MSVSREDSVKHLARVLLLFLALRSLGRGRSDGREALLCHGNGTLEESPPRLWPVGNADGRVFLAVGNKPPPRHAPSLQPGSKHFLGTFLNCALMMPKRSVQPCSLRSIRFSWAYLSLGSYNNVPQTLWLKTTEMCCLTALESRSPKSRCQQGRAPSETCAGEPFPPLPSGPGVPLACGHIAPASASGLPRHSHCLSSHGTPLFLSGHQGPWIKTHANGHILTSILTTRFPNKVTDARG